MLELKVTSIFYKRLQLQNRWHLINILLFCLTLCYFFLVWEYLLYLAHSRTHVATHRTWCYDGLLFCAYSSFSYNNSEIWFLISFIIFAKWVVWIWIVWTRKVMVFWSVFFIYSWIQSSDCFVFLLPFLEENLLILWNALIYGDECQALNILPLFR